MEKYIVVHPVGIWSFDTWEEAHDFIDSVLYELDLNEEGYCKSRTTVCHPPI